jgi:Erv1 / Alr family
MVSNKTRKNKMRSVYSRKHFESNDGMLTSVWGPSAWHLLHTMSFNYPVNPTCDDKRNYREYVLNLQNVLPCGKCRANLKKNFKKLPFLWKHMESRQTFSKYIYDLHEVVNKMLHKDSGLSYNDVRERYEHFRARCANPLSKPNNRKTCKNRLSDHPSGNSKKSLPEKGCTEPIYGEKSKCVLKIVPQKVKCETFQMDKKCIKRTSP